MPMWVMLGLSLNNEQLGLWVGQETSEQERAGSPSWVDYNLALDVKLVQSSRQVPIRGLCFAIGILAGRPALSKGVTRIQLLCQLCCESFEKVLAGLRVGELPQSYLRITSATLGVVPKF